MLVMIAAMTPNRVIGKNGELPWDIREEMEHFRKTTKGATVIMGETTYYSLGGPLKGRKNIVLTKNKKLDIDHKDVEVCYDMKELLTRYENTDLAYVIGGGAIYKLFIDLVDMLVLSVINNEYEGDTYFPDITDKNFNLVQESVYSEFIVKRYVR